MSQEFTGKGPRQSRDFRRGSTRHVDSVLAGETTRILTHTRTHKQWKNGGWIALSCHDVNKMAPCKPVTQTQMFLLGISRHRTLRQPHAVPEERLCLSAQRYIFLPFMSWRITRTACSRHGNLPPDPKASSHIPQNTCAHMDGQHHRSRKCDLCSLLRANLVR